MTSVMETIWFPLLFVLATGTWIVLAIAGALRRRDVASHSGSVTVRLPEDAHVVSNDGTNLNN